MSCHRLCQLTSACVGCLLATIVCPVVEAAPIHVGPSDDLYAILGSLSANDEVIVQQGTYQSPGYLAVTWPGTAAAPIVIRPVAGARPILRGVSSQNLLNIDGSHFTLRGFEIIGSSHGLRLGNVDHALLEDLVIHDTADVGISCNLTGRLCDALTIRRCEIYDTAGRGEGMYLGCNDGACTMRNSVIELNYIHDLGGDQGDGIEIKTGSYGNTVRDNIIVNSGYPAITLYGFSQSDGTRNIVERNLVWGTDDNGIQIVGQVIVRNNIIVNAQANGIQSKSSQGHDPHSVTIVNNTIYNAGNACLKTNGWSAHTGQIVANNALYCPNGTAMDINGGAPNAVFTANVVAGSANSPNGTLAAASLNADLGNPTERLFYPPIGSKLIGAADPSHAPLDDFEGTSRPTTGTDVGAYERTAAQPQWPVVFGFKPPPANEPHTDAGPAPDSSALSSDSGATDAASIRDASVDASRTMDSQPGNEDSRSGNMDSHARSDGGKPRSGTIEGGCGCNTRAPSSTTWALLLLLLGQLPLRNRQG